MRFITTFKCAVAVIISLFAISVQADSSDSVAPVCEVKIKSSIDAAEQPALFYVPKQSNLGKNPSPTPLLLSLHTWSSTYQSYASYDHALEQCRKKGWIFISPQFRGPNKSPEACASELAVQDVLDAVEFARKNACVDDCRIYILGVSGGGHMALVMAERAPHLWAGVSAWVPITDLASWYDFCKEKNYSYAQDIELCLGGPPSVSNDTEYKKRSSVFWLDKAKGLPIDIQAGIRDGYGDGTVPIYHSLRAFNVLAKANGYENKMLNEQQIEFLTKTSKVPDNIANENDDESGRQYRVLLRRTAGPARLTLYDAGHDFDNGTQGRSPAFEWLDKQIKNKSKEEKKR